MKIKAEHKGHIQEALSRFSVEKVNAHRQFIINEGKAKDVEKRLRWDLLYYAGLSGWLVDNVYPYANDDHIDTVLRQLMASMFEVRA
jgi:hypothetical protein